MRFVYPQKVDKLLQTAMGLPGYFLLQGKHRKGIKRNKVIAGERERESDICVEIGCRSAIFRNVTSMRSCGSQ